MKGQLDLEAKRFVIRHTASNEMLWQAYRTRAEAEREVNDLNGFARSLGLGDLYHVEEGYPA